ncbi:MAG: hypothetical protein LBM01_00800 [Christensenellaceae bacterium]|jgi:bifunctional N-acetylglucosamine-1-phosphate-uridyltransferase/glucosamine-1-phosphate-acetyltransferase GlmU-like protein|nr:hypothetical protein [Christensenellaceae bacterium]
MVLEGQQVAESEEETEIEAQVETQTQAEETGGDSVFVLVLKPDLSAIDLDEPLMTRICGVSMLDCVKRAVKGFEHKFVDVKEGDDITSLIREHGNESKWTIVLYADTPLLTKETLENVFDQAIANKIQAGRLPRGWIFETKTVLSGADIEIDELAVPNKEDFFVVNGLSRLERATRMMQARINERHLENGVKIANSGATYIEAGVEIARSAVIEPNCTIKGDTVIKKGATILAGTYIESSVIEENAVLGPYARIRPKTTIGEDVKIGNFVEIKNSQISNGTKIAHMTYVGDAVIGEGCNIGCGVVFCNFDGKTKSKITLGDKVFVGSNSNLVAPLTLATNSYVAAGSTITQDLEEDALGIARARQVIKENWRAEEGEE